jgi:aminoglycoside phosphotransferase (APT) family kinase protein
VNEEAEKISKIVAGEFAEKVLAITPLAGKGDVNKVFLVETKAAKMIFRTNEAASLDEYEKEKWAAKRAVEKRIPTPEILRSGVFDNQAYSIQKYVEGAEGRSLPAGDDGFIWGKLGEYAKQIHQIEVGGFGLSFRDMTAGGAQNFWLKYLEYNIESLNDRDELLKLGVITQAQSKIVREVFKNLRERKFRFGLNHGDLSLKNTIVDDKGTVHLIDWGSAEASIVPHHELIQLLKMNLLENDPNDLQLAAFLDGYGISDEEFKEMTPDLEALSILRAFDKLRWALDRKIESLDEYVSQARITIEKYL